jgi:hypothetical protein
MKELLEKRIEELEKDIANYDNSTLPRQKVIRDIMEANLNLAKRMFDEFCREIKE